MTKEKVFEIAVPGAASVILSQYTESKRFSVKYDQDEQTGLSYAEACTQLGDCVMHALQCAQIIDADGP